MTIHLTLLVGKGNSWQRCMLAESFGHGVLDSACTNTVARDIWVNENLSGYIVFQVI